MGASAVNACSSCFNPKYSKESESLLRKNPHIGEALPLPTPVKIQGHYRPETTTNTEAGSSALADLAETASTRLVELLQTINLSAFDLMLDRDGFRVFARDTAEGYMLWSEFSLPFTPEQFIKFVSKTGKRKEWDSNVAECRRLSQLSETVCITYQVYKRFLTIASRDLLIISKTYQDGDTWIDASTSIDSPMMPANKSHVRAKLVLGGYIVKPLVNDPSGNLSRVVNYSESCIGGSLPKSMVKKMSATAMPKFVNAVTAALKKDLAARQ
jgi:hypothetical protein